MSLWSLALSNLIKLPKQQIVKQLKEHPLVYKDIEEGIKSLNFDKLKQIYGEEMEADLQMVQNQINQNYEILLEAIGKNREKLLKKAETEFLKKKSKIEKEQNQLNKSMFDIGQGRNYNQRINREENDKEGQFQGIFKNKSLNKQDLFEAIKN